MQSEPQQDKIKYNDQENLIYSIKYIIDHGNIEE